VPPTLSPSCALDSTAVERRWPEPAGSHRENTAPRLKDTMSGLAEAMPAYGSRDLALVRLVVGVLAMLCLVLAARYDPMQVASGDHLSWIGVSPGECPGCPLCGLSRGFSHGMRGEFGRASALNFAFWPVFLTVLFLAFQTPMALKSMLCREGNRR